MSDRPANSTSATTRRGNYQPRLPEHSSAFDRWIVRAEIAVGVGLAIGVLGYMSPRAHDEAAAMSPIASRAVSPIASNTPSDSSLPGDGSGADAAKGQVLYMQSCTSCHGQNAQGLPHMGVNLRTSKFVAETSDRKLAAFIKTGRRPMDPKNTTGLLMPPRGGNLALDDDGLADIVAFLRILQKEQSAHDATSTPATPPAPALDAIAPPTTRPIAHVEMN